MHKENLTKKKAKIENMIKDANCIVWDSVGNQKTLFVYNLLSPMFILKLTVLSRSLIIDYAFRIQDISD